jgi:hypothetical protein
MGEYAQPFYRLFLTLPGYGEKILFVDKGENTCYFEDEMKSGKGKSANSIIAQRPGILII